MNKTYKPGYYTQYFTNALTGEPDYNIAIKHPNNVWEGYDEVNESWQTAPAEYTRQIEFGFDVGMNTVEWIGEL